MSRFSEAFHFLPLLPFVAAFLAGAFFASPLVSVLARGFAAAFLATAFLGAAFFFAAFGASSASSEGFAGIGFSRFGRGPTVGLLSLVRISVIRNTVISSR